MMNLDIRESYVEIFITYADNFPAGIFYITEYEVEILMPQLEVDEIESFEVAGKTFIKSEVGSVRIGGNIGLQFN